MNMILIQIQKQIFTWKEQLWPKVVAEAPSRGNVEEAVDDVEEEDEEAKKGQQGVRVDSISEKRSKNSRAKPLECSFIS